jgi:hypothetical protein
VEQLLPHREEILGRFKRLFEAEEFRRAIDAATNTPSLFKQRIQMVHSLLESVVHGA